MKRKITYSILFILFVVASGFKLTNDPTFLQTLKERLQAWLAQNPGEKAYLQVDKTIFKPGEDIWFNAFVLDANTHKPASSSDVVYVELIDPKGKVSSRLSLLLEEGTAHGDFALQKDAPGGLYQLRAYTHWMKNDGTDFYFKKEIQVQRVITPRLLLKLDYEKEAYGPGDAVEAKLTVKDLKNQGLEDAAVDVTVRVAGDQWLATSFTTDREGNANINFNLPDTLSTTDGILQSIVRINGVEESIMRSIPIVLNKITLRFFPEGGNAVENIESRMAFQALNEFGKGADVAGTILDENHAVVTSFESFHMGMGAFQWTPSPGKKYFARIEKPKGNEKLIPLPKCLPAGFTLSVTHQSNTTLRWKINAPYAGEAYLVGQSHGNIHYSEKVVLTAGENNVEVATSNFPMGIGVFTLFNGDGVEQCERLVFMNHQKGLKIQIKTDKEHYLPREQVKVDIETLGDDGKPVQAKISLAVIDDQLISFADDKQDNILSQMFLSSEVKGEIQEPSFYFDPKEPKAYEALDHLLMTQGWRRFNWKDIRGKRLITFMPEKLRNITGMLSDNNQKGSSGQVTLMELGGKRRLIKLETTSSGHFIFRNIDPSVPNLLLTKKPNTISMTKELHYSVSLNDRDGTLLLPEVMDESIVVANPIQISPLRKASPEGGMDMTLEEDVSQLSEVVVTALGYEEVNSFCASVVRVRGNIDSGLQGYTSVENALQGRIAGVQIQSQNGNPGAHTNIRMRGISSMGNGRSEPLYVVNGVPIGNSLSENFANGSMFGPGEIESIEVINSPEATFLYGSRAANGVLLITTRTRINKYSDFRSLQKKPRFNSYTIVPRAFSAVREYYVPPPSKEAEAKRNDFRTTVHWSPAVVTDEKGKAHLSFFNNDAISAFRITAEGFTGSGLIGRTETVFHTELPLSLDAKLPQYLGFEDELKLPVRIKNETSSELSGKISFTVPAELSLREQSLQNIKVPAKTTSTVWFTLTSRGIEGEFPLSVKLMSGDHSDEISQPIRVKPAGFPVRVSFSAKATDKTYAFSLSDAEKNSVKAEVTVFTDIIGDLFTGADRILQEPHGCFEQVSSSTFPNILALQFMKQSGQLRHDVEKRALSLIQNGYRRLQAYEIRGGGFEWYGEPPAHVGLTAFGLVEFSEMKKVYTGVDEGTLQRTRDFLMNKRDGKGGFTQNRGKYGFSGASEPVTNAYIVYALSETGTKNIIPEYETAYKEAVKSKDMYRLALTASSAYNLGRTADYNTLIEIFKKKVATSGFSAVDAEHSIVNSYGRSLNVETLSFWAIALMKDPSSDFIFINDCIQYLVAQRRYGTFGSTQSTTLALTALTKFAERVAISRADGEVQIFIGNMMAESKAYKSDVKDPIVLNDFANKIALHGDQKIRVTFANSKDGLPYSVDLQWYTKKPQSNEDCNVSLKTSLDRNTVRLNESVRLTATLKNKTTNGLPTTVAVIGIPAGLSVQSWQLKELKEKGVFDFYEIMDDKLVLYYRELGPSMTNVISLDLKAEIPGTYTGSASSAYLYYMNEYKDWVKGNSITIQ
jgi:TonB-dependent SusC/RagA subfamily outer membrane receptor